MFSCAAQRSPVPHYLLDTCVQADVGHRAMCSTSDSTTASRFYHGSANTPARLCTWCRFVRTHASPELSRVLLVTGPRGRLYICETECMHQTPGPNMDSSCDGSAITESSACSRLRTDGPEYLTQCTSVFIGCSPGKKRFLLRIGRSCLRLTSAMHIHPGGSSWKRIGDHPLSRLASEDISDSSSEWTSKKDAFFENFSAVLYRDTAIGFRVCCELSHDPRRVWANRWTGLLESRPD